MSSRQDQQLARLQREADRANQQQEQDGLATIAGTDSQGRTLIKQSGEIRPLDAYHSNAGGQLGQAIEVSGGMGAIAPRSRPRQDDERQQPIEGLWWAVLREEVGNQYRYWLGGSRQEPVLIFTAPIMVPGCQEYGYATADHYTSPEGPQDFPGPSIQSTASVSDTLCNILQTYGGPDIPGNYGIESSAPGPGPWSVTATPTPNAQNPYNLSASLNIQCGQGRVEATRTLTPETTHEAVIYYNVGSPFWPYRFAWYGRVRSIFLGQGRGPVVPAGAIASYAYPAPPDRGSGATLKFAIYNRQPIINLQHTPKCVGGGVEFDQTKTLIDGQSAPANWPYPPDQHNQTLFGDEETFFLASGSYPPAQGQIGWITVTKYARSNGWPVLNSRRVRVQDPWIWPQGQFVSKGIVF